MSHLPTQPTTGTDVADGYDAELHDFIRELSARTNLNDYWVKYLIARISGGGGDASDSQHVFTQIESIVSPGLYGVSIWGNGYAQTQTGVGVLQVMDMALASSLAVGERYLAASCSVSVTGGSDT